MQIALHFGAHVTDQNRLVRSLGKNRKLVEARGISIPRPSAYRKPLNSLMHDLRTQPLVPGIREGFLNDANDMENPDRLVMSNTSFLGMHKLAVARNHFYPKAIGRLGDFCHLFENDEVELFLAICDPATFLPSLFLESGEKDFDTFIGQSSPMALRWSELIERILQAVPGVPLTVWCNEDTPLIWEQVLREMLAVEPTVTLEGSHDLLSDIMTNEGMTRFESYLTDRPGMTDVQKRRVIAAFMDKFGREDEVEQELDLPGWSNEFIEALSEVYDEDVYVIERMQGVSLITP